MVSSAQHARWRKREAAVAGGYLGDIRAMSFDFAPRGWAQCRGQHLPISLNPSLYALLGTRYGGNGTTTFALPALPGSAANITEHPPPAASKSQLGTGALLLRGHELLDRSDLTAAITEYQLAVDSDATLAEPHMYLGIAQYLDGNLEAALHELRAAAFLDPALWPAMFYSAVCFEALGQLEAAAREYRHVVRVAAKSPGSRLPRRHSAWHEDLIQLARKRSGSSA